MLKLIVENSSVLSRIGCIGGIHFKREDEYRLSTGVNGSKVRACEYLIERAKRSGFKAIVSGSACVSPQHAIVATVARANEIPLTDIIGGTTLEKAVRSHRSVRIAYEEGAKFHEVNAGYNPVLQKVAKRIAEETGAYYLRYGIAIEEDSPVKELKEFHDQVARQCQNIDAYDDLILPFGSGNTGVGVLWGLSRLKRPPKRVQLMVIGPDRLEWASERLAAIGVPGGLDGLKFELVINVLHQNFASYGDRMPETFGSIKFHPNYEGKIVRYLKSTKPDYWTRRDGTTGFWIVGGPIE